LLLQFESLLQFGLSRSALGSIAKDKNEALEPTVRVHNWRCTLGNRNFPPVSAYEESAAT